MNLRYTATSEKSIFSPYCKLIYGFFCWGSWWDRSALTSRVAHSSSLPCPLLGQKVELWRQEHVSNKRNQSWDFFLRRCVKSYVRKEV